MSIALRLSQYQSLVFGEASKVELPSGSRAVGVFPGAFNPFHRGHREMASIARERLGGTIAIELSLLNVEKASITCDDANKQIRQIRSECDSPIIITTAPDFLSKSKLFPACAFVVGVDTILRVGDPRFYQFNEKLRDRSIEAIAAAGCRFLVFGRMVADRFLNGRTSQLPASLRSICEFVSEESFRVDISSTQLRRTDFGDSAQ